MLDQRRSVDQFISHQLDRVGDLNAQRPCRFEVDDEFELGRLKHRQIGGFRAAEDATRVDAYLPKHVGAVSCVAHQATGLDNRTVGIRRGYTMARRQGRELDSLTREENIGGDKQRVSAVARKRVERCLDLRVCAGLEDFRLEAESARSLRQVSKPPWAYFPD
jgi:hypothetical protein